MAHTLRETCNLNNVKYSINLKIQIRVDVANVSSNTVYSNGFCEEYAKCLFDENNGY